MGLGNTAQSLAIFTQARKSDDARVRQRVDHGAMPTRRWILSTAVLPLLASCGGSSGSSPQSESNLYDRQLQELLQASAVVDAGATSLRAWAQEAYLAPGDSPSLRIDPVTGLARFDAPSTGASVKVWFVGAAIVGADNKPLLTAWQPRTIWVLRGNEYVSSRELTSPRDTVFAVGFPQPPFARDGASVVVEFVNGATTRLSAAMPVWLN